MKLGDLEETQKDDRTAACDCSLGHLMKSACRPHPPRQQLNAREED